MRDALRTYSEIPSLKLEARRLSDQEYTAAMGSFIIVCADVVPINRERRTLYLTRRSIKPMQGWWIIGGRVPMGVDLLEGIAKNVKRETGLALPPERFVFVTLNRYLWKDREQEPQSRGSDSLAFTYAIELSDDELTEMAAKLTRAEYEQGVGLHEFTREKLEQLSRTEYIHPMLFDLYDHIFPA